MDSKIERQAQKDKQEKAWKDWRIKNENHPVMKAYIEGFAKHEGRLNQHRIEELENLENIT